MTRQYFYANGFKPAKQSPVAGVGACNARCSQAGVIATTFEHNDPSALPFVRNFLDLNGMEKGGCVYIMTNEHHTTLYVGVTADLYVRATEHRERIYPQSFTTKYNLTKLVYYESFQSIDEAIHREKQIKAGSRKRKEDLIATMNPEWKDLYDVIKYW